MNVTDTSPPTPTKQIPIVGIGASAGGLAAFKGFFEAMPAESGMAFILVQHLDPTHESLMVDLLSRHTEMQVIQVEDRMQVQANHVYMIPPNWDLAIQNGELLLTTPVQRRGMRMPIDFFLKSLAKDQKERAICIILSGTGSDGTVGLKAVKSYGGMVVVQLPEEAQYDGMPSSAIATGVVDHIVPVSEMPQRLLSYVQHSYVRGYFGTEPVEIQDPDAFNNILSILHAQIGHDFHYYKKTTLIRRIQRRMSLQQLELLSDYVSYLRRDADETHELFKDLLIGVTGFFREKEPWELLDELAIAPLVQAQHDEHPIRVWVPGCATGEEAYTIAILLHKKCAELNLSTEFQIFATDIDAHALDFARTGCYPESIAHDVPRALLEKYFRRNHDFYQVANNLRKAIVFSSQNLIRDPPFSKLDLISCRNLLIYLDSSIQPQVIQLFHFALNRGGFLLLGNSETVGKQVQLFEPISKKWRIYRRLEANLPLRGSFPIVPDRRGLHRLIRGDEERRAPPIKPADIVRDALLAQFAPCAVLINQNHEVLYHFGDTTQYLTFPPGEHSNNLFTLARDGLTTRMRGAVQKSLQKNAPVSIFGARVRRDAKYYKVELTVNPLNAQKGAEGLLLVTFRDVVDTKPQQPEEVTQGAEDATIRLLENELSSTKGELQNTIEELETSNEELKASNEEVMSMNEELQSSNEELETSKEELQSLNEELNTVNSELQEKVRAQEQTTNDLQNLINSTNFAVMFLDTQFCIKLYAPAAKHLFNLIPTDVGRPLRHVTTRFTDPDLLNDAEKVLNTLKVANKEVQNDEKCWYQRKISPYRTHDNRIGGIVITFEETTELRKRRDMLAEQNRRYADAQAIAHFGYWTLDLRTKKLEWSDEVYDIFEIPQDQFGASYAAFLAAVHPEDRDLVEKAYRKSVQKRTPYNITHRILLEDGRIKYLNEICRTEYDSNGSPLRSVGTVQDVTELRELKHELRTSQTRYKALFDHLNSGVAVYESIDGGKDFAFLDFNPAGERIEAIARGDIIGRRVTEVFPGVREFGLLDVLRRVWRTGRSEQYPDAFYRDGRVKGWRRNEVYRLPSGEVVAVYSDVSSEKAIERSLYISEGEKDLVLDAVSDVILHLGTNRKIKWASKTAAEVLGRSRDDLIGLQCHTVCGHEGAACQNCPFTRSLNSHQIERGELTDLRGRSWNVIAQPLFDNDGQVLGVVEIRNASRR
jgi:two-component system CheB/CheR fusion protein